MMSKLGKTVCKKEMGQISSSIIQVEFYLFFAMHRSTSMKLVYPFLFPPSYTSYLQKPFFVNSIEIRLENAKEIAICIYFA